MSYLILHRASLITLFCIFLFGNTSYAQADIPFIYYYSREDSAFIIERADHSEQKILATYPLEEEYIGQMTVDGPGWSSSGEFFTWMSRPSEGGGSYAKEIFIIQRDTGELETISTQDDEGIDYIEWSPTSDLLLIVSYDTKDVIIPIISLYDPDRKEYVWRYTSPQIPLYPQQIIWSPDGRYITISLINTILLIPIEANSEITTLQAQLPIPSRCSSYSLPHWLSNGWLVYTPSNDELLITNIDSGEQKSIALPSDEIEFIDWSPDEQHAFVYTKSTEPSHFQLHLLTLANLSVSLVSDDVTIIGDCATSYWSQDSQYAAFVSEEGNLNVFSTFDDVVKIVPDTQGEIRLGSQIEWASGTELFFTWYAETNYQFELYQYDVTTSELKNLSEEIFPTLQPIYNFSVQNNFLFLNGIFINLETQEIIELVPTDELLVDTIRTDELVWDPSGRWAFLLSMFNSLYHVKVASVEGVVFPEIALCPLDSKSCFGWMPITD
jgi:hypothetical protein